MEPSRSSGGCTFAEAPARIAPEARIIWHADLDPETLKVAAEVTDRSNPEAITVPDLLPWLTVATDANGTEHAVLSDGWHHIRLDVEAGRLAGAESVLLHYRLHGTTSAERRILPLRRLLDLHRHRRFTSTLFPRDPRMGRMIAVLRVRDALDAGASHREIAMVLFGEDRVRADWSGRSDSLRSRIRRLVRDARVMARGGFRDLLRR